jgi:molybdopterin/thiamine biosynthesis adenylyltransferase
MKYDVVMTHEANQTASDHLLQHYQQSEWQEDLCFALWRSSTGRNRKAAIVYQVILPKDGERNLTQNASFTHGYASRAIFEARRQNAGLAFMHSHPVPGWQDLSYVDEIAERTVLAPPARATGRPLVGMTVGSDRYWSARFWDNINGKPQIQWCEKVRLVGPKSYQLQFNDRIVQPRPRREALRRTYDTWGTSAQNDISRMRVGIVGLGSVGCIVAEAMARIGIQQITLFDPDRVEEHNLDRLMYGTAKDIGMLKVDLAKTRMELSATATQPAIKAIPKSIKDRDAFNEMLDCDIILSCVDRPMARDILNYVANAHLIPVIDCGVAIRKNRRLDTLEGAHWKAHIITPYHQCLRCNSQYNTGMVSAELDGSLDNPSYISALPDEEIHGNQNVFPFSLGVAALATNLMTRYLIGQEWWPAVQQQDYQFQTGKITVTNEECSTQCAFRARRAMGDAANPSYIE